MSEPTIAAQVLALQSMTVPQLREQWKEVFGEATTQRHRVYMIKRLAWKLQEDRFGKLTPEQEARVAEYRREIEALPPEKWFPRSKANRAAAASAAKPRPGLRDRRLPPPGSVLTREWRGNEVHVRILESGFEYEGRVYRSLSAVASEITGTSWNGWVFFNCARKDSR
jgi:hypothetical protein